MFGKCSFKEKKICKPYDEIRNRVFEVVQFVGALMYERDEEKGKGKGKNAWFPCWFNFGLYLLLKGSDYSWHMFELNLDYLDCWKRSTISFVGLVC